MSYKTLFNKKSVLHNKSYKNFLFAVEMVRNYKRKTDRATWEEDDMQRVVRACAF